MPDRFAMPDQHQSPGAGRDGPIPLVLEAAESSATETVMWHAGGTVTFDDLTRTARSAFGMPHLTITDGDSRARITSDWELQLAIVEWSEREQAREADVLHAWSLRITRRLASPDTRTWGMCALWELSCRPENHHSIGEDLIHTMLLAMEAAPAGGAPEIEQDGAATGSKCDENLRTVAMAAATCWMLGQVASTRKRLPLHRLTEALLKAHEQVVGSALRDDELGIAPAGALSCLLQEPTAQLHFHRASGEARMVELLESSPAAARAAATRALRLSCEASAESAAAADAAGGTLILARIALQREEKMEARVAAMLTLNSVLRGTAHAGQRALDATPAAWDDATSRAQPTVEDAAQRLNRKPGTGGAAEKVKTLSALLRLLGGAAEELMPTVLQQAAHGQPARTEAGDKAGGEGGAAAAVGPAGKGSATGDVSVDAFLDVPEMKSERVVPEDSTTSRVALLLHAVLCALWIILGSASEADKAAAQVPVRRAGEVLLRLLRAAAVGPRQDLIAPCCGAMSHLLRSELPPGLWKVLLSLLPSARGRTLEAVAALLAAVADDGPQLSQLLAEPGQFNVVLTAAAAIQPVPHRRAGSGASGGAGCLLAPIRDAGRAYAHSCLSRVVMMAVARAAQVSTVARGTGGLPGEPRASGRLGSEAGSRSGARHPALEVDQVEKLSAWIAIVDQDGDGKVSKAELHHAVVACMNVSEEAFENLWARLDITGDGSLSLEELSELYGVKRPLIGENNVEAFLGLLRGASQRSLAYNLCSLWACAGFPALRAQLSKRGAVQLAVAALNLAMSNAPRAVMPKVPAGAATIPPPPAKAAAGDFPLPASRGGGWWVRIAQWALASLWLLGYDDANAEAIFSATTPLLAELARHGEPLVQGAALGVASRLVFFSGTAVRFLSQPYAVELFWDVSCSTAATDKARATAADVLDYLCRSGRGALAASADDEPEADPAEGRDETGRPEHPTGVLVELVGSDGALVRQAIAALVAAHSLETSLASLIEAHASPALQKLGCRRVALLAMSGKRRCRGLLEAGATSAIVSLLQRTEGDGAVWCLRHPELLWLALTALLNLATEPANQRAIARGCLERLVELVSSPPVVSRADVAGVLVGILENLSTNNGNRKLLYRAELSLRSRQHALITSGKGHLALPARAAALAISRAQTPSTDEAEETRMLETIGLGAIKAPVMEQEASAKPETPIVIPKGPIKEQYLQWLGKVLGETDEAVGDPDPIQAITERLFNPPASENLRRMRVSDGTGAAAGREAEAGRRTAAPSLPRLMCKPLGSTWRDQLAPANLVVSTARNASPRRADSPRRSPRKQTMSARAGQHVPALPPLRVQSDDGALHHDPWRPPIEKVEIIRPPHPPAGAPPAAPRRSPRKKPPVQFAVQLADQSVFRFNPGVPGSGPVDDDSLKRSSMTAWKGAKGSKYWEGLFGSYALGKAEIRVHHHEEVLATRHPGDESMADPPPTKLVHLMHRSLPPEVAPLQPASAVKQTREAHYPPLLPPDDHRVLPADPGTPAGVFRDTRLVLLVAPAPPASDADTDGAAAGDVWSVTGSIWEPRREASDCLSLWSLDSVLHRALELDCARAITPAFEALLLDEVNPSERLVAARDLDCLADTLRPHAQTIYGVFHYFAATARVSGLAELNHTTWSQQAFDAFVDHFRLLGLPEMTSDKLHRIFAAAAAEMPDETDSLLPPCAHAQSMGELLRYGYIRCLLRLAVRGYPAEAHKSPVAAVGLFLDKHLAPLAPEMSVIDTDALRERLYTREMDELLRRHEPSLRLIFHNYAASMGAELDQPEERFAAVMAHTQDNNQGVNLTKWMLLLSDAQLHDAALTKAEGALAFVHAQPFVADELKRRRAMLYLSFDGFCEALCRLALAKPLPSRARLAADDCQTVRQWAAAMVAKGAYATWVQASLPNRAALERGDVPLVEPVELLLQSLVGRFDSDGDGVLCQNDMDVVRRQLRRGRNTKRLNTREVALAVAYRESAVGVVAAERRAEPPAGGEAERQPDQGVPFEAGE